MDRRQRRSSRPEAPISHRAPSGESIAIFFYDGPVSQAVAFEGLLNQGELLASRMVGTFSDDRDSPQIVHIATDGETYGHHHRNGEMALAYALYYIEEHDLAELTNYGEYLERFPPTHEATIIDDTSWSCIHGIERWRSDCGCNTGSNPRWNQKWRAPLRNALDWLRDEMIDVYTSVGTPLLKDPWSGATPILTSSSIAPMNHSNGSSRSTRRNPWPTMSVGSC